MGGGEEGGGDGRGGERGKDGRGGRKEWSGGGGEGEKEGRMKRGKRGEKRGGGRSDCERVVEKWKMRNLGWKEGGKGGTKGVQGCIEGGGEENAELQCWKFKPKIK